jgi:hypothetical protein
MTLADADEALNRLDAAVSTLRNASG